MITVRQGELVDSHAVALLRPVTSDWAAPTSALRRLEIAAGPDVEAQCRTLGELPVGSAVVTSAGPLRFEFLVHVVVRSQDEPITPAGVRRGLQAGLGRLAEWAIESVAMPPLGTGAGNLDADESADLMVPILWGHLRAGTHPARIEIVVESDYERDIFERSVRGQAPA